MLPTSSLACANCAPTVLAAAQSTNYRYFSGAVQPGHAIVPPCGRCGAQLEVGSPATSVRVFEPGACRDVCPMAEEWVLHPVSLMIGWGVMMWAALGTESQQKYLRN